MQSKSSSTKGQNWEFANREPKQNVTSALMMSFFRWEAPKGIPKPLQTLYSLLIMYAESTACVSAAKQIACVPAVPMFPHLRMYAWGVSHGSLGWDALELFPRQSQGNLSVLPGKDQGKHGRFWTPTDFFPHLLCAGGQLRTMPLPLATPASRSFPGQSPSTWKGSGVRMKLVWLQRRQSLTSKPPFDGWCDSSQELPLQSFS